MGLPPKFSCSTPYTPASITRPNPNPYRFRVARTREFGSYSALWVNYPDCTNYDGDKILVVKGGAGLFSKLDPHFIEGNSPKILARFIPNEWGWDMACKLAESLGEK